MNIINCKYCKIEFEPKKDRQVFCCAGCRIKYGNEKQRSQMKNNVYEEVVKCAWCNNEFTRLSSSRKRYCSEQCKKASAQNQRKEALKKIMKEFRKPKKQKKQKPKQSISDINQKARALHMSYGEYVSKYGVD